MGQEKLAAQILRSLNIAVLQRVRPGEYTLLGDPPSFYDALFPSTPEGPCSTPWRHSYMLEFFYTTAEEFFSGHDTGTISSGIWEEEGVSEENQALVADAMTLENCQIITLHLLKDSHTERVAIMRKARELLLERRLLNNALETFKNKSRMDGLTKLLNRATFMELLASHAVKPDAVFSLIMLDIDHFKNINDTFGHQAGDMVLSEFGKLLPGRLRQRDIVARYGGEEFIIILPLTSLEHACKTAEKLRKSIEGHTFGALPDVTASLGCVTRQQGENMEDMIRRVDLAMYSAKHNGRNTVCAG